MPPHQHAFARTDTSRWAQWWWTTDRWLLGATGALILLGVLLQFGTSPAAAARLGIPWPFHFAVRQCVFALLGAAIVLITSVLTPKGVRRVAFFVYLAAILAMAALPFLGHNAKGATRWVEFAGFALQPSEFMKPALIVLVAWMFAESQKGEVPGVLVAFGLYGAAVVLLLMEPDIGQTALITAAFGAAFWVAGVPIGWIVGMGATAIVGLGATPFIFPHVAARLHLFLDAGKPSEPGQVERAAQAIAAGRGFGRGPGEGIMKVQIPDMHTDFAYSAAAEEYGLWLSLVLISLFALLVIRGLFRSMRISDPFEQIAAAGLFAMVGMQAFINIIVNLGLAPTKGMTLPFISYGGSSMLAMGLTMGMALALTRRQPGAYMADEAPREFVPLA
jgi:cell division protein FtsW